MSEAIALEPTIFDRAWDKMSSGVRGFRFNRAKAHLEKELFEIIETANGHQAKGLPQGHAAYGELYKQAIGKIAQFCTKWNVEQLSVEKEVPALRELEQMSVTPHPAGKLFMGIGALIAVVVGAILVGCMSGLVASGYHWTVAHLCR